MNFISQICFFVQSSKQSGGRDFTETWQPCRNTRLLLQLNYWTVLTQSIYENKLI